MKAPRKVVVDTNVFVSSFLSPTGPPRKIVDLWHDGKIRLCLCAEIVEEYIEVLLRMGFADRDDLKDLLELIRSRNGIDFVAIDGALRAIPSDPADDKFVECAVASGARFIVSGDRHLLRLREWDDVRILSPTDFLASMK